MQSDHLSAAKANARVWAKAQRAGFEPALGMLMAAHVVRECLPPAAAVVGGVWPMPGEIDTRYLLEALAARGFEMALPETPPPGQGLVFRKWVPGEALVAGRFGTEYPEGIVLVPEFILVPLLAFDRVGNRLGYGGGYYDRTLAALPAAFRLGCGFAAQEMDDVPVEATDLRLHAVATEKGVLAF